MRSKRLGDMKLSKESAKMILDAMKNKEIQYLQQRKKPKGKPKRSDKPGLVNREGHLKNTGKEERLSRCFLRPSGQICVRITKVKLQTKFVKS